MKDSSVRRLCQIGAEGHGATELLNLLEVAPLKMSELSTSVSKGLLLCRMQASGVVWI